MSGSPILNDAGAAIGIVVNSYSISNSEVDGDGSDSSGNWISGAAGLTLGCHKTYRYGCCASEGLITANSIQVGAPAE